MIEKVKHDDDMHDMGCNAQMERSREARAVQRARLAKVTKDDIVSQNTEPPPTSHTCCCHVRTASSVSGVGYGGG